MPAVYRSAIAERSDKVECPLFSFIQGRGRDSRMSSFSPRLLLAPGRFSSSRDHSAKPSSNITRRPQAYLTKEYRILESALACCDESWQMYLLLGSSNHATVSA